MRHLLTVGGLLVFALSGCSAWGAAPPQPAVALAKGATLLVSPRIAPGALGTQAIVPRYTGSSVQHLVVSLHRLTDDGESQALVRRDLAASDLGKLVTFSNLYDHARYRVRAAAYKAAGTDPADRISTDDARSWTEIEVGDDDRPTMATLSVQLIDVPFSAVATTGIIAVGAGELIGDGEPIGIEVTPRVAP